MNEYKNNDEIEAVRDAVKTGKYNITEEEKQQHLEEMKKSGEEFIKRIDDSLKKLDENNK